MSTPAEVGAKVLANLAAQAQPNRQAGIALRAQIRQVMAAHPVADRLTAPRIRALLSREPLPSIRRIQEIVRKLRAESLASRF